jgi:4-hydroxy-3-polyprenylbenzoate decarboxylase
MGQMMFTKYVVAVGRQRNYAPHQRSAVPSHHHHATSEIASGRKLGIDATKKISGEGFKRAWPPLIKMDESGEGEN